MIDRVANDMGQGIADCLEQRAIQFRFFSLQLQTDFLTAADRKVAHDPAKLSPDRADRLHPSSHHAVLDFARDLTDSAGHARKFRVRGDLAALKQRIARQHQLTGEVHQLVKQADVDTNARRFACLFRRRGGFVGVPRHASEQRVRRGSTLGRARAVASRRLVAIGSGAVEVAVASMTGSTRRAPLAANRPPRSLRDLVFDRNGLAGRRDEKTFQVVEDVAIFFVTFLAGLLDVRQQFADGVDHFEQTAGNRLVE